MQKLLNIKININTLNLKYFNIKISKIVNKNKSKI